MQELQDLTETLQKKNCPVALQALRLIAPILALEEKRDESNDLFLLHESNSERDYYK